MKDTSGYLVAVTTLARQEDAVSLARALLDRRLIACANIVPSVRSLYRWQGTIEDDGECLMLLKTGVERFDALKRAFDDLHPYDVPELIALAIEDGAEGYLGWLGASLSDPPRDSNE